MSPCVSALLQGNGATVQCGQWSDGLNRKDDIWHPICISNVSSSKELEGCRRQHEG